MSLLEIRIEISRARRLWITVKNWISDTWILLSKIRIFVQFFMLSDVRYSDAICVLEQKSSPKSSKIQDLWQPTKFPKLEYWAIPIIRSPLLFTRKLCNKIAMVSYWCQRLSQTWKNAHIKSLSKTSDLSYNLLLSNI